MMTSYDYLLKAATFYFASKENKRGFLPTGGKFMLLIKGSDDGQ